MVDLSFFNVWISHILSISHIWWSSKVNFHQNVGTCFFFFLNSESQRDCIIKRLPVLSRCAITFTALRDMSAGH